MKLRKAAVVGAVLVLCTSVPGTADAASTNLYLLDDGSPHASMSTASPSGGSGASRNLQPSTAGRSEDDPARFQEWSYPLSTTTASVNEFTIWVAPADPSGEGKIAVSVDILDCGTNCVWLAGGTKSLSGVVSPTRLTIPLTINGHEFGTGHDLSVKVTVPATSSREVTIYYGSKKRNSNLHLSALDATPPTTTTTIATATTVAPTTTIVPTTTIAPTTTVAPTTTTIAATTTSAAEETTSEPAAAAPTTTTTVPPSSEPDLRETGIRTQGPDVVQMIEPTEGVGVAQPMFHDLEPQEGLLIVFSTAVEAFRLYWQVALALGTVMATLLIIGFSRLELPRPPQNPFERIRANRG